MPQNNAIAFIDYSYNRYSLAVLTGVLEENPDFADLPIHFLRAPREGGIEGHKAEELNQAVIKLAASYDRLVVAFSFHTPNIMAMASAISLLKTALTSSKTTNVLLIAGGPHPSGDPLGTLEMGIDVVVVGEGELSLPQLLEHYFSGKDYRQVLGLSYLQAAKYHFSGRPKPIDLSDYPPFALKHRRFAPIEIGRGCPWACSFCQTPFLMGGRMRYRSVESTVHYATLAKQAGLRDLRFITPVAFAYGSEDGRTVNLAAIEALLEPLSHIYGKEHLFFGSFPSEVRPESVSDEALSLVKRYCANDNIIIGAQSGSERMLKAMHRGHGVAEVIEATKLIIGHGMTANVDFIFGMPGEAAEDIAASLALMDKLTQMGARVHSHTFMPLVGTPMSQQKPGVVDESTRNMLENLRSQGLEYGHWKMQEQIAATSTQFLQDQQAQRDDSLKKVKPIHRQ
ncbi:MAG: TIGR04013 family B12-binding domain/radical SAM domain-containing protein [Deinococcales bacterium]